MPVGGVQKKLRVASERFCRGTGRFQGVRKRGRGGRALPRTHRAASLAVNTRLESIRLANLTHNRLQHNAAG